MIDIERDESYTTGPTDTKHNRKESVKTKET